MEPNPFNASPASSIEEHGQYVPPLPDDHELFTHIVLEGFPSKNGHFISAGPTVDEARISGFVISSLCGKSWVPSQSPSMYPLCQTCIEYAAELGWSIPS
jgi:hypothetical protein